MNKKIQNSKFKIQNFISKTNVIILLSSILILGGCGIKKPPVPWESVVPKRIVDLRGIPTEGRLLLEWTAPKENTDKSVLIDLAAFQISRSEGTLIEGECRGCGEKTHVAFEKKLGKDEEVKGKRIAIFLEDQEPRKVYVYQVVSINRRGYAGAPSNPIWVYWDHPPRAPIKVSAERGDKRVDLSWEPVEHVMGYNIYRKKEGEEFPLRPLNREILIETHYTDLNVENERKYLFSVRAVRRVVKTDVEGKGSLDIPATPTDLIPPTSPVGLVAIPLKDGIELDWNRNREPDLQGYYIYRRKPEESEFKRLNQTPLVKETFLDANVELRQDYEYAVTAVDNSVQKNESPLSEEVRVKYLY